MLPPTDVLSDITELALGALFLLVIGAYAFAWQAVSRVADRIALHVSQDIGRFDELNRRLDDLYANHLKHMQEDIEMLKRRLR